MRKILLAVLSCAAVAIPTVALAAPGSAGSTTSPTNRASDPERLAAARATQQRAQLRRQRAAARRRARARKRAAAARSTASPKMQAIAACESGGNPRAIGGGGTYRGKYQFDQSTWASVGGSGDPAAAPEAEQDRRAAMLYARVGSSAWPVCGH